MEYKECTVKSTGKHSVYSGMFGMTHTFLKGKKYYYKELTTKTGAVVYEVSDGKNTKLLISAQIFKNFMEKKDEN